MFAKMFVAGGVAGAAPLQAHDAIMDVGRGALVGSLSFLRSLGNLLLLSSFVLLLVRSSPVVATAVLPLRIAKNLSLQPFRV